MKRGKDQCLLRATGEGWLDTLLEQARAHPWHVRMQAYATHLTKDWSWSRALPYPSFLQWDGVPKDSLRPIPALPPGSLSCDKSPSRIANALLLDARRPSLITPFDMSEERVPANLATTFCALSDDSRVLS